MNTTKSRASAVTDAVTYRRLRFSQAAIDKLTAPPGARVKYVDARGTGLVLEVSGPNRRHPQSRVVFKVPLRFGVEQVTITLGQSSPTLRLAAAERQCTELKFMRVKGVDPRIGRETSKPTAEPLRKIDTLRGTIDRFVDHYLGERNADGGVKRSEGYRRDTERYLRNFETALGATRDVVTIERRELREYLTGLVKHRTAANRAHAAISAFFAWCADAEVEIVAHSPAIGLKKPGGDESARDRCLDEKVEIPIFWRAALAMPLPFSQLYRLLLATAQRLNEVATLRWSDIVEGLDGPVWIIPDTKSGRPQSLPLSSLALEILGELPRTSAYAFTGRGKGPVRGFARAKANLDRLIAKICQDEGQAAIPPWRNHDLRRSAATLLARLRVSEFDIARLLNHANREGETKIYNRHSYDDVKAIALEKLAARLRVLTGAAPDDNVVTLADRLTG